MLLNFQPTQMHRPSQEVTQFVDNMIKGLIAKGLLFDGPDRRTEKRHVIALPVSVVALNEQLQPVGKAFTATTKDIARGGLALIHSQNITSSLLGVQLTDTDGFSLQAVVEVLRSRQVGPYFEIAGKFATKVYSAFKPNSEK